MPGNDANQSLTILSIKLYGWSIELLFSKWKRLI
jgi:hypothetical protein